MNTYFVVVSDSYCMGVFGSACVEQAKKQASSTGHKLFKCQLSERPRCGEFFSFTGWNAEAVSLDQESPQFIEHEYTVPTDWLCALVNGDESGLEGDSLLWLEVFIGYLLAEHGHAHVSHVEDIGFTTRETLSAAVPWLACDASRIMLLEEKSEQ